MMQHPLEGKLVINIVILFVTKCYTWECYSEFSLCFTISQDEDTWSNSFNLCREMGGFMVGDETLSNSHLQMKLGGNISSNAGFWIALTNKNDSFQWFGNNPGPVTSPFPVESSQEGLYETCYIIQNMVTVPRSCRSQHITYCVKYYNNSSKTESSPSIPSLELQLISSSIPINGIVAINQLTLDVTTLTCQIFNNGVLQTSNTWSANWIKDESYIEWKDNDLPIKYLPTNTSTTNDVKNILTKEGVYYCTANLPNSAQTLVSNPLTVVFEDILSIFIPMNNEMESLSICRKIIDIIHEKSGKLNILCDRVETTASDLLHITLYYKLSQEFQFEAPRDDKLFMNISASLNLTSGMKFSSYCKLESFHGKHGASILKLGEQIIRDNLHCNENNELMCTYEKFGAMMHPIKDNCSLKRNAGVTDFCPTGFSLVLKKCIKVVHGTWKDNLNACMHFSNVHLSIQQYIEYYSELTQKLSFEYLSSYYIPLVRIHSIGSHSFMAPTIYKEKLKLSELEWKNGHPISKLSCVAYNQSSSQLFSTSCDIVMPYICLTDVINLTHKIEFENTFCPAGWLTNEYMKSDAECWKFTDSNLPVSWQEATRECQNESANLIIVESALHQLILDAFIDNFLVKQKVWIGLENVEKQVQWHGNVSLRFTNWDSATNYNNNYGAMNIDGKWNLEEFNSTLNHFICQHKVKEQHSVHSKLVLKMNDSKKIEICILNPHLIINCKIYCSFVRETIEISLCKNTKYEKKHQVCYELRPHNPSPVKCFAWTKAFPSYIESESLDFIPLSSYIYVGKLNTVLNYKPKQHDLSFRMDNLEQYELYQTLLEFYIMNNASLPRDVTMYLLEENLYFAPQNEQLTVIFYVGLTKYNNVSNEWKIETDQDLYDNLILKIFTPGVNLTFDGQVSVKYIRSINICPGKTDIDGLMPTIMVNKEIILIKPCQVKKLALLGKCNGDSISGGQWDVSLIPCPKNWKFYTSLQAIYSLNISNELVETLIESIDMAGNFDDVSFNTIKYTLKKVASSTLTYETLNSTMDLINTLIKVNISKQSINENYHNFLLGYTENIDEHLSLNATKTEVQLIKSRLSLYSNIVKGDFIGLSKMTNSFHSIRHNIEPFSEDVITAIIFPQNLITEEVVMADEKNRHLRLSFLIINDTKNFDNMTLDGKYEGQYVLNSVIAGANIRSNTIFYDLGEPIKIYFKPKVDTFKNKCVYWDYKKFHGKGGWSQEGCVYQGKENKLDVCMCNHLTCFAQIVNVEEFAVSIEHKVMLDLITVVGCSMSIIGLLMTVFTFLFFRKWREFIGNKIIAQLAISLSITQIIFLLGIDQIENQVLCQVMAMLLQYFILSSFCWMLVKAMLLYIKIVRVIGTHVSRFMLKASIFSWGAPILCVVLTWGININNLRKDICWLQLRPALYSVFIPVGVMVTLNLIIFFIIIYHAIYKKSSVRASKTEYQNYKVQLKMGGALFSLLGVGWFFGFIAFGSVKLIFTYVFCIFSSFQGFFIFIFYVLRNEKSLQLWKSAIQGCSDNDSVNSTWRRQSNKTSSSTSQSQLRYSEKPFTFNSSDSRIHEIDKYLAKVNQLT